MIKIKRITFNLRTNFKKNIQFKILIEKLTKNLKGSF